MERHQRHSRTRDNAKRSSAERSAIRKFFHGTDERTKLHCIGDENMEEIMRKIDDAFRLISSIAVKGNDVEIMALARQELRSVYNLMKEKEDNDG